MPCPLSNLFPTSRCPSESEKLRVAFTWPLLQPRWQVMALNLVQVLCSESILPPPLLIGCSHTSKWPPPTSMHETLFKPHRSPTWGHNSQRLAKTSSSISCILPVLSSMEFPEPWRVCTQHHAITYMLILSTLSSCVSALTIAHCRKKHFWWRLRAESKTNLPTHTWVFRKWFNNRTNFVEIFNLSGGT